MCENGEMVFGQTQGHTHIHTDKLPGLQRKTIEVFLEVELWRERKVSI